MLIESTINAKHSYQERKKEIRTTLRNKMRKCNKELLQEIDKNHYIGNLYPGIKSKRRGFQIKTVFYVAKGGNIIAN